MTAQVCSDDTLLLGTLCDASARAFGRGFRTSFCARRTSLKALAERALHAN